MSNFEQTVLIPTKKNYLLIFYRVLEQIYSLQSVLEVFQILLKQNEIQFYLTSEN